MISRPLWRDEGGATIVEFALVLLPMCVALMGSLDLGYRVYAQSIIVGSLREAARMASTGNFTSAQVDAYITDKLHNFRSDANIVIDKRSYSDFANVAEPEPFPTGPNFIDVNGNGKWDCDQGKTGLGQAESIVFYEVTFSYPTLFPFSVQEIGFPDTTILKANTIVSNEPYKATPPAVQSPQPKPTPTCQP